MSFKSFAGIYEVTLTRYDSISDAQKLAAKLAIFDQVCVPYPTLCLSSISDDSDEYIQINKQTVSIKECGHISVSSNITVTNIHIPTYAIRSDGYFLHQYSEIINNTLVLDQSIVTKLKILKVMSKNAQELLNPKF
ncbi:hypothetical protein [Aliivibrio salmonicida]|nr:hypothetical protein [Aliivibrio salmonicida]